EAGPVDGAAVELEPAPAAGHPAPDFALETLDGQEVRLSDFKGQPVIINFWATWCGPCRIEMPHLQAAYAEHQADGLVVLGVNLTARDSVEDIPEFRDEFGLTFPIILDQDGEVATTYRLIGQPASVFVNKEGVVHEVFHGPINQQFIDERVELLLGS
ncbi:MAG: TlpA disulfide reductase family protein, partial [Anaerolineae bacterium]|nr:TlpA disulfide reductase family protein [Anaerolineae bacterium]